MPVASKQYATQAVKSQQVPRLRSWPASFAVVAQDVALGTVAIAVDDAALTWSPYNWYLSGSAYRLTNNPGAYVCFSFTGTGLAMAVDGSIQSGSNIIAWRVDGGDWQTATVATATTTVSLATGLTNAVHSVFLIWKAPNGSVGSRWTGPTDALKITGFTVTGNAVGTYPNVYSRSILSFWDSLGEGTNADGISNHNSLKAAPFLLREALRAEIGAITFNGQGFTQAGSAVPLWTSGSSANTAWDKYFAGQSRLVGGLLAPVPTAILSLHGTNDGLQGASDASVTAAINGLLAALASAAPGVPIIFCEPPGRYKHTALLSSNADVTDNPFLVVWDAEMALGLVAAGSEGGDGAAGFGGASWASYDGLHPTGHAHARLAAHMARAITALGVGSGATITSLAPSSAAAGGGTFTLTVNGTGFINGAVISWNGAELTTTFVSTTQLTASVPSTLIASSGVANVTVANP